MCLMVRKNVLEPSLFCLVMSLQNFLAFIVLKTREKLSVVVNSLNSEEVDIGKWTYKEGTKNLAGHV